MDMVKAVMVDMWPGLIKVYRVKMCSDFAKKTCANKNLDLVARLLFHATCFSRGPGKISMLLRTALLILLACISLAVSAPFAFAEQPAAAAPPPEKLTQLSQILNDPAVSAWIKTQVNTKPKPAEALDLFDVEAWEGRVRSNFHALFRAVPTIPAEYGAAAARIRSEAQSEGFAPVMLILAIVLVVCIIVEWAVRKAMGRVPSDNPVVTRAYFELAPLAAFVVVAMIGFFAADWPKLVQKTLLFYLLAAICFRLIAAMAATAVTAGSLSPFVYRRVLWFSGILLAALATKSLASLLSINPDARLAVSFLVSLVLLAIACETVWRRPAVAGQPTRTKIAHTIYFLVLWLIWTLGLQVLFWLGIYAVLLPPILSSADRIFRAFALARWREDPATSIKTLLLAHGARALIIIVAIAWLAIVWHYNTRAIGRDNAIVTSIILGLFKSLVVLVIADLFWIVVKTLINRKLASVAGDTLLPAHEMARRARLRTLLPIFRNGLAALLLVITALTVLAQLGVEIGPLIAGAGIFGVALGFGSQTLVKDVISGVFYLMDDAFRVGEYIQSGSYKGTVESFSLRSVRLRHHRGPVFTVPFSELGAVQNMSRDWSIDKFMLRVGFDTDVAKAKKLVKNIGAELLKDPEVAPMLIETLKMKGVEQIGDYGIELSFAFTAQPGTASQIRRRAYVMIREAFSENGIEFAQPTVQVGGDEKSDAAAAALTLSTAKKKAATEEAE